ncbi:MAG: 2-succinyl-5-enolpyruvyl-6-hydroxy-3-cyclohexene-1-carboxylic-acid synthase [Bacteroidia bacterium]
MNNNTIRTYQFWQQAVLAFTQLGLKYAVLSPGSRCAPISLSFLRNENIQCYVVPDERSAAFIALGLAQQSQCPVAMVSTSGTAALNYAPAITEAFFQRQPLICITADRPQEWLGQADNQAIYQQQLFAPHVLKSLEIPTDLTHDDAEWYALRLISEAWNFASGRPKGPVHLNVPMREPLYLSEPLPSHAGLPKVFTVNHNESAATGQVEYLKAALAEAESVMVVAGLLPPSSQLTEGVEKLAAHHKVVFVPDVAANLLTKQAMLHSDLFLSSKKPTREFAPDLLLTLGGPVVSKNLKQFFRDHRPQQHIHIDAAGAMPDTFQSLTKVISASPAALFRELQIQDENISAFKNRWIKAEDEIAGRAQAALKASEWNDLVAAHILCKNLPENSFLHLGNSLPVRLVNLVGLPQLGQRRITVFSNRGTSGIDGCVSTALGNALNTAATVTLLVGDLSFFYDRNGLWHRHIPGNLRIIVLNNNGGGIFRNISGPAMQTELEPFFAAGQELNCELTAKQHRLDYTSASERSGLVTALEKFYLESEKASLLEIMLPDGEGGKFLQKYFDNLNVNNNN